MGMVRFFRNRKVKKLKKQLRETVLKLDTLVSPVKWPDGEKYWLGYVWYKSALERLKRNLEDHIKYLEAK